MTSSIEHRPSREPSASVVTIVRGRAGHLANVLVGLQRQQRPAFEIIVVQMGGPSLASTLGNHQGPTVLVELGVGQGCPLPLAAARNQGAAAAQGGELVFLDVDCIPGAGLVGALADRVVAGGVVASAQVQYLPPDAAIAPWTEAQLFATGRFHPARPSVAHDTPLAPELLWSLAFAMARSDFDGIGGFDEGYIGYGGEDTDLGLRAHAAGLDLVTVAGARAYHQFHASHDPPLQHFDDVVMNARRFHERWARWPMEGWLAAMADLGLIAWTPGGDDISALRQPTTAELDRASVAATVPLG